MFCFCFRLFSSINISADKWLLTLDEHSVAKLGNPPSLADGLDRKTELVCKLLLIALVFVRNHIHHKYCSLFQDLRYLGCEIIQSGAILLRIPQVAAATAQILYQRFYYQRSFVRHHFEVCFDSLYFKSFSSMKIGLKFGIPF